MKFARYIIALLLVLFSMAAMAGSGNRNPVLRLAKNVMGLIDTLAVRGIDRDYIDVPKRPWQVTIRGNTNWATLKMSSTIDASSRFLDLVGDYQSEPHIRSDCDAFAGFWAGYRGYGIGYSQQVGKESVASLFTLGATGGCYGINFRRHSFDTDEFDIYTSGQQVDGTVIDTTMTYYLWSPLHVKSFILDGYYMFNGRRFSYAAAYDQSAYQLRSAGSLMVGAMYYYSHIDYADPLNADMILQMDDIGRIRQWQVSIGAGYAYNFVPVRGVLINVNVMPMLTCLNRMKVYRYDSTYRQMAEDGLEHSYEEMEDLLYDTMDDPSVMQLKADPQNPEVTETGRMTLNFNARASLTCNLAEWAYVNVYGQLYNFRFRQAANHGSLTEWFVKAALGIRL